MTTADRSVRLAWADDVSAITRIQRSVWAASYPQLPLTVLPDTAVAEQAWSRAVSRPTQARERVLVALERAQVCGFVLTAPAEDPDCDPSRDGEVMELTVEVDRSADGHDARLSQAAVDTLRADGFVRAITWIGSTDDQTRARLTEAGWAADGAHRALDLDGDGAVLVKQIRLHSDIS